MHPFIEFFVLYLIYYYIAVLLSAFDHKISENKNNNKNK